MSSQAHLPTLMTAEQMFALPESERHELVRGEIRRMTPAGLRHGWVSAELVAALHAFVREHRLGRVATNDPGFILHRDPDTVRAPDVAFIAAARVPDDASGFAALAPDLVAEVVSPNDRASEVTEKALDWLAAGVRLVWVIDPGTRIATVYRQGGDALLLIGDAALDGEDVLPGFRLPLPELFS